MTAHRAPRRPVGHLGDARRRSARTEGAGGPPRRAGDGRGPGRSRGARRRAGAVALWLALAVGPATAWAASPLLWVTPMPLGAATLAADGTVAMVRDGGERSVLAHGVRGDSLRACSGALLAVDDSGTLRSLTGDASGPAVSPHSRPACLPDGRIVALSSDARSVMLLSPDLKVVARQALDALPDGDPTPVGDTVAVLTQPTQRYRHGVLGDEIEAGAVALLSQSDLSTVASYTVAPPAVIEQRRVAPFPAAGPDGLLITRSTPTSGAGVVALARRDGALAVVAEAPPIGTGDRWLNLFATAGSRAYAVRTPDLGGPLVQYALAGGKLHASPFALHVTNHVLGSRNLDLGILLPPPKGAGAVDVMALPTPDLGTVKVIACTGGACIEKQALPLAAPLSSNLAARWRGARLTLLAGERDGRLQSFALDASLWTPADGASAPVH